MLGSNKNDYSDLYSLHSTVKKHHPRTINHAKSYDDLLMLHELAPSEVKVLLNNDKSLKLIKNAYFQPQVNQQKHDENFINKQKHGKSQKKQLISQLLSQSIRKQNVLIQRQLFDPYKYFGSTSQLSNIQQSTRHHQSKLQAMFSDSNSQNDHSLSYRKNKLEIPSQSPKPMKIKVDVQRISNSVIFQKLQKLKQHQQKLKQKRQQKKSFSISNKQNVEQNNSVLYESLYLKGKLNHKDTMNKQKQIVSPLKNSLIMNKKSSIAKQQNQINNNDSLIHTQKKSSIMNHTSRGKTRINCSPKSYVKEIKQNYIKMNINNLQKVRLKLKLNSKNN